MATKSTALRPEDFKTAYEYETARELARLKEPVELQLYLDNENNKDDVVVQINGYTRLLQRGVPLTVPREVAIQLAQSQHQNRLVMNLIAAAAATLPK